MSHESTELATRMSSPKSEVRSQMKRMNTDEEMQFAQAGPELIEWHVPWDDVGSMLGTTGFIKPFSGLTTDCSSMRRHAGVCQNGTWVCFALMMCGVVWGDLAGCGVVSGRGREVGWGRGFVLPQLGMLAGEDVVTGGDHAIAGC